MLGPWPFQLIGLRDDVQSLFQGPPQGTVIEDPRMYDRLVKFPSGELPAAFCAEPSIGGGTGGEQPIQGIVDEVEVVRAALAGLGVEAERHLVATLCARLFQSEGRARVDALKLRRPSVL